ncbi:MAG: ABC transporter substrate-binding protein, partial [Anaerolineaceae bacterium]|nr:ABC transporter substrate-binding protein [Anaerolineaceae bacterium]
MPKRLYVILSVLIAGTFILSACGKSVDDPIGTVEIDPGDPIHIASMLTISGPTSFLGIDSVGAIKIAIEERGGELLGHRIEYTSLDSGCNAEGGQTVSEEVAADPSILGVIGTNCSSA